MSKKRNVLKEVIGIVSKEEHTRFVQYLLKLEDINFGVKENENFLQNKYEKIFKFYKEQEQKNESKKN